MSSLIEDIEKAKNKKTLLFGNIQFDHLKRSDSKEVRKNAFISLFVSLMLWGTLYPGGKDFRVISVKKASEKKTLL